MLYYAVLWLLAKFSLLHVSSCYSLIVLFAYYLATSVKWWEQFCSLYIFYQSSVSVQPSHKRPRSLVDGLLNSIHKKRYSFSFSFFLPILGWTQIYSRKLPCPHLFNIIHLYSMALGYLGTHYHKWEWRPNVPWGVTSSNNFVTEPIYQGLWINQYLILPMSPCFPLCLQMSLLLTKIKTDMYRVFFFFMNLWFKQFGLHSKLICHNVEMHH